MQASTKNSRKKKLIILSITKMIIGYWRKDFLFLVGLDQRPQTQMTAEGMAFKNMNDRARCRAVEIKW